jgi:Restriction alleviation protein Lar
MTMGEWQRQYEQKPVVVEDPRLREVPANPCPFCGSRAISLSRRDNYVHCERCGADGPEIETRDPDYRWRLAVQEWNHRVTANSEAKQ